MIQESAINIAKSFYDAAERRDFRICQELLQADAVLWNEHEQSDSPARPLFNGSHPLWSVVSEFRYTERKYAATDRGVTVEYVARGATTHGRRFALPVTAHLFIATDGRSIRRIEEYFTPADMAAFQTLLSD